MATLGLLACAGDQLSGPRPNDAPSFAPGGKKAKPSISVALASSSFEINGAEVGYTATIQNPGADMPNVLMQATIEQGSASRQAGGTQVVCPPNGGAGVLISGTCTISFAANASNSAAGTGTLVSGNAKLVIGLYQTVGTVTTLIASETVRITLVEVHTAPYISNLVANFTSLTIGGAAADYTVTITNPTGTTQSIVIVQAYIIQNGVSYGAYGSNVQCPTINGSLPPGDCTFTWHTGADAQHPFTAGPATWRLELVQGTTTLDFREKSITLQ